ncbi:MAG: hypothetical protein M3436_12180 [Pseudomonadota bacterium]|nr:hypothetical protein [Pseudomonadota bacterium]
MSESAATRATREVKKLAIFVLTLVQASLAFSQDQSAREKVANDSAKRTEVLSKPGEQMTRWLGYGRGQTSTTIRNDSTLQLHKFCCVVAENGVG